MAVVHAGITSASREAIRPVLKRFNTLYFYNTQYEGGVCDRNCFCTGSTPAQNVDKLVPFGIKKFGKKIYTWPPTTTTARSPPSGCKKYCSEDGGEVVATDFFPLEVTDFGAAITKIQAAKPDFIMSALVGGSHISFYRQWAAAGMNKTHPGGLHDVRQRARAAGDVAGGAQGLHRVPELLSRSSTTEANQAFLKKFLPKYGPTTKYVTQLAIQTYHGHAPVGGGREEGRQHRPHEGDRGAGGRHQLQRPRGKTAIDPKTHHCSLDVYIAEAQNRAFKVLESYPAAAAGRHRGGLRPQEESQRQPAVRHRREDMRTTRAQSDRVNEEGDPVASAKLPTPDELKAVGRQLGMTLSDDDVKFFLETMAGNVAAYHVIEAMAGSDAAGEVPADARPSPRGRGEQVQRLVLQDRGQGRARAASSRASGSRSRTTSAWPACR